MRTMESIKTHRCHAGVSLLEVMISIGILSIGLLSVLALIPAGRTYLSKAAIDDRAALLVPNAYATMRTLGLFSVNALSWVDAPQKLQPNTESPLVVREVSGVGDVFSQSPNGSTLSAWWTIETIDTEIIDDFYGQEAPPFSVIRGTVPPLTQQEIDDRIPGRTVTIDTNPNSGLTGQITSLASGSWSRNVPPAAFSGTAMQIFTSGSKVGQVSNTPWTDYTISATYTGTAGSLNANPSPSSYRQYGARRKVDFRRGKGKITYTAPSNANDSNPVASQAHVVPIDKLENATSQGRGTIARSVSTKVQGTLWRMELGTRRGDYTQYVDFADTNNAPPKPRAAAFPNADITADAGYTWLDSNGNQVPPSPGASPPVPDTPEDVDWYRFDVDAGDLLKVTWNDYSSPGVLLPAASATGQTNTPFPIYLNTTSPSAATMLDSIASMGGSNFGYYSIPNDGYVVTRAQLKPISGNPGSESDRNANIPTLLNTFGPEGQTTRSNPAYDFTVELSRTDRVIVVDPLMATRLDKVIALNGGATRFDPYYLRRHRFADFQQKMAGSGTPRAFVIPRLNWQKFTSGDVDTMLAMAEKLFRDQDNLSIDLPPNDDDAPSPRFDVAANGMPARRQAEGRMSWLFMVQPEDPGPVSANWAIGKYFDVSIVVFQDRKLPPVVAQAQLDGEFAMSAQWSDLDGMLTVTVPASGATTDLDDDDLRELFRTGAWLLLAPQTNYDADPLDSTQRLEWVRIQTARIGKQPQGGFVVDVLLETEPPDTILYRSKRTDPNISNVVVLAYQGVVSVVSKTMRLE